MNMRTYFIYTSLLLTLCSCKVKDDKIIGSYKMKYFPKNTLQLNSDHTFVFTKINPNPYLDPFDHLDEFYFVTAGKWRKNSDKEILLNSSLDSLAQPLAEVQILSSETDISNFNFIDAYNDPVEILYVVNLNSGLATAQLHSSMKDYSESLQENDSLEFHFYGYQKFTFVHKEKVNADYQIRLLPPFLPKYFTELALLVKNRKLKSAAKNIKFLKN